ILLSIIDDDFPMLSLSIDAETLAENASNPAATATLTRNTDTGSALVVQLLSDSISRVTVPTTVTIPAGQSSVTFPLTVIDNTLVDGTAQVTILATAAGFVTGSDQVIVTDDDAVNLALQFSTTTVTEGAASPAAIGTIARDLVTSEPLVVTLVSSPAAFGLTSQVVIPANQASVTFIVNAPEDELVNGTRVVLVTAYATTSAGTVIETGAASANLTILDNDGPTLTITVSDGALTEGLTRTATVTRNTDTTDALVVTLASSDTTEITVPATVTIPAGETSAEFTLQAVLDGISDGLQSLTIAATAASFNPGSASVSVSDFNLPDLRVTGITLPATGRTGETVQVSWTVANGGVIPTTGAWVDRVYLSTDDQLGSETFLGSQNFSGTLAVGGSYNRSLMVTLPELAGTFYLFVITDAAEFIGEGSETNNVRVSGPIDVQPAYRATVSTPVTLAPANTPVPLTGSAYDPATGNPVANKPVTVRILVRGTRREISVMTDAGGNFATTFQPLPGEAGHYAIGADHPGVTTDLTQDEFTLVGMRTEPRQLDLRVVPGTPLTGQIPLINLGDTPLTGLSATVIGAPGNVNVQLTPPAGLAELATEQLAYSITAADASQLDGQFVLRITSAEGAVVDVTVNLSVVPLTAQLIANPGFLSRGMLRGTQTLVSVEVTNRGGAPTGSLIVELPDVPWMSLVSATMIPSLAPGARTVVTLVLTPAADIPLGLYEGNFVLLGANTDLSVSFSLQAVSEAVGDLRVNVQDEYTFFVAEAPLVAGANVVLRDAFDQSIIVAQGTTDAGGSVLLSDVPEGNYLLEVRAEKHGTYRAPHLVRAGILSELDIFVQRQTVTYNWAVTPTEIEDHYRVVLETTFETNVPIPVVTLDVPKFLPNLSPGEVVQLDFTLTNHGLIAAEDVQLLLPTDSTYKFEALTTELGVLPAKSSITIPVMVSLQPAALSAGGNASVDELDPLTCLLLAVSALWWYRCAGNPVWNESTGVMTRDGLNVDGVEACYSFAALVDALRGTSVGARASRGGKNGGAGIAQQYGIDGSIFGCREGVTGSELSAMGGSHAAASGEEGVCAQVRIRIDQEAVMTRAAFAGELEIINGHELGSLEGVQLVLDFRDDDGNSANDMFAIVGPELTGISAIDGTGVIAPSATGLVRYTFIPTREAAAEAPTRYVVGGTLRYIDPGSGQEVVIPLFGAAITVYPDPVLELHYFQQRDVHSDDPHTEEVESSEPFALGLMVTNTGSGTANNFAITSSQPKIIENDKGLLIDFKIIGTQVNDQLTSPSLTAEFGNIAPGETGVAQWIMTSTLQGKFIDYSATFEHADSLGGQRTSLIDSVQIHELIHTVRVDSPTDDGKPDFLVNDIPDADSLPDTLYLSDGTVAVVNIATNVAVDGPVVPGDFYVQLTASMTSGWNYLSLPDPGTGYRLAEVMRSDGKALRLGDNAWQTDRTFPSSSSGAVREFKLHLFDLDGTGNYTLRYVVDDFIAPVLEDVVDVTPDPHVGPVSSVDVVFSEPIDLATFDDQDVTLTRNGGPNLITSAVTIAHVEGSTYRINGLETLTAADGVYELTVIGAGIRDYGENAASVVVSDRWGQGAAGPFVDAIQAPGAYRNTPAGPLDVTFSEPVDLGTFDFSDLTLTRNGGSNLITAGVTIEQVTGSTYRISGLAALTGLEGTYVLSVVADNVDDFDPTPGVGVGTVQWTMDVTAPGVLATETLATNPRNIVVQMLDVTMSEPVNLATFTRNDLLLTRNGGPNLIDDRVTIEHLEGATYRIRGINWVVGQEGLYELTVIGSGIFDAAGNAGTGAASTTWVMDTTPPATPTDLMLIPDTGVSATDNLINTLTPTLSGVLGETGLTVRLVDLTEGRDLGYATIDGTGFSKVLNLLQAGQHRIQIRVVDAAGNVNQAARLLEPRGYIDIIVDQTPPVVINIPAVEPNPRMAPVSTIDVELSEAIDASTFDWQDLILSLNGGPNLITSAVTVSLVSGSTYSISGLTGLTSADGTYQLTVQTTGISDLAGNAGIGVGTVSWLMDSAGAFELGALRGRLFEDHDGNGVSDDGDQGLAGWAVFLDANGNGQFEAGDEPQTVTDADGRYEFSGLPNGIHRVGVVTEAGWSQTLPAVADGIYVVTLGLGQVAENLNFGFYVPAEVRGDSFNDLNGNAAWDVGEPALVGWTVYLDQNVNGTFDDGEPSATTGADGSYILSGIRPGSYIIGQVPQPGWTQTSPGGASADTSGDNDDFQSVVASLITLPQSLNSSAGSFRVINYMHCGCGLPSFVVSGQSSVQLGNPNHFLPPTTDGNHYAWQDADPSTADVIEIYYDFRAEGSYANLITSEQIFAVEAALGLWETASLGRLQFMRNTLAPASDIINIGVGDLAALGGVSGPRQVLALGGGTFHDGAVRTISNGVAWLDIAEVWDNVVGNGNIAGTFDFATVAMHEIGHALGLGHPDDVPTTDVMDSIYSGERIAASIMDQMLIQILYNESGTGGHPGSSFSILPSTFPGAHVIQLSSQQVAYGLNFGNQAASASAVTVVSVTVNGGDANRSGIRELTASFDLPVTVGSVGALTLFNHTTGQSVDVSGAALVGNGTTSVTWVLADGPGGMADIVLADGRYTAELAASATTPGLAQTFAFEFHKLAGDVDGDALVNFNDYIAVRSQFNASGAAYRPGDADGDG
ncbi:MAG: SdrD B-like domain-containing protein, partial [Planctomycetaceae bacterium]